MRLVSLQLAERQVTSKGQQTSTTVVVFEATGKYEFINPDFVETLTDYGTATNIHLNSGKDVIVVGYMSMIASQFTSTQLE